MSSGEAIAIDAHAHLYPEFEVCSFLRGAVANLSAAVTRDALHTQPTCVVFLLSTPSKNGFRRLKEAIEREKLDCIGAEDSVSVPQERVSMQLTLRQGGQTLVVIAGRQIVSREGLEVLALGTRQRFEEGQSTETLVRKVSREGAIPVLPWGVGKWLGRRGRLVEELIEDSTLPPFFLGDSANRPAFWPRPSQFRRAEERGIKNLPGSDPLPFPNEARRVGCSGVFLDGSLDLRHPAQDLKRKLLDPSTSFQQFGRRETPLRFLRNQLRMQLRKLT